MAISLGRWKQEGKRRLSAERLAKEYAKQQKKAKSRGFFSNILGKGIGGLLGAGLSGLLTVTSGGVLAPLMGAIGQFGGKKLAFEATRGMGADTSKLKEGAYGYGKSEAKTLREGLEEQARALDPYKTKGGFGAELLGSYVSAGLSGELGGVKGAFKSGKGLTEAEKGIRRGQFWMGGAGDVVGTGVEGGVKGALSSVGDLFGQPWGKTDADAKEDLFDVEDSPKDLYDPGSYEIGDTLETADNTIGEEGWSEYEYEGGGLVSNKPPTIADFFEMHGKSLGGSNKQSIAEMLGRR